jgi:hypothetical protein
MRIYNITIPNIPDIIAEGIIFNDESCVTRLLTCKNPFLIQEKYNGDEILKYIENNSIKFSQFELREMHFKDITNAEFLGEIRGFSEAFNKAFNVQTSKG